MVFSSTVFLFVFLPAVIFLYYVCPIKFRNALLLMASLLFYAWGEPVYIIVMIASIIFNYSFGLILEKLTDKHKSARLMLALSVIGNLSILGFFKYSDFIIGNINNGFGTSISLIGLALPIGISFYTFQAMSYVIDVYRRKTKAQRSIIKFATYISLFPQLIAGPIVRYVTIENQLSSRTCNIEKTAEGIRRFIMGLGKKVILANQIGLLWNEVSAMDISTIPALTAWLGAVAFTFQIYFDFSGYSDMAIGLGKIFGFDFDENFNYPYMSKTITEFWRRWHISLSTWFKEYLYIPLGGNRKGIKRQIINIMIVWGLTGLWHGAEWNFVIWGIYYGIILIIEKVLLLKYLERLPAWFVHVYTMILVVLGWVIFAETDMRKIPQFMEAIFGGNGFANERSMYLLTTNLMLICICTIGSINLPKKISGKVLNKLETVAPLYIVINNAFYMMVLILSIAFLVSDTYNPFLYFRF